VLIALKIILKPISNIFGLFFFFSVGSLFQLLLSVSSEMPQPEMIHRERRSEHTTDNQNLKELMNPRSGAHEEAQDMEMERTHTPPHFVPGGKVNNIEKDKGLQPSSIETTTTPFTGKKPSVEAVVSKDVSEVPSEKGAYSRATTTVSTSAPSTTTSTSTTTTSGQAKEKGTERRQPTPTAAGLLPTKEQIEQTLQQPIDAVKRMGHDLQQRGLVRRAKQWTTDVSTRLPSTLHSTDLSNRLESSPYFGSIWKDLKRQGFPLQASIAMSFMFNAVLPLLFWRTREAQVIMTTFWCSKLMMYAIHRQQGWTRMLSASGLLWLAILPFLYSRSGGWVEHVEMIHLKKAAIWLKMTLERKRTFLWWLRSALIFNSLKTGLDLYNLWQLFMAKSDSGSAQGPLGLRGVKGAAQGRRSADTVSGPTGSANYEESATETAMGESSRGVSKRTVA